MSFPEWVAKISPPSDVCSPVEYDCSRYPPAAAEILFQRLLTTEEHNLLVDSIVIALAG